MAQNAVAPGSELASLAASLPGRAFPSGSSCLTPPAHHSLGCSGGRDIPYLPPQSVKVRKESSPRFQDLESWVGQRAPPSGLEAEKDLQVTRIRGQADPLKLRLRGAISSPLLCSLPWRP